MSDDVKRCAPDVTPELLDRFWARVDIVPSDGDDHDPCWEWQWARGKGGYGVIDIARRQWKAHRLSWVIEHGEIPDGMSVLHRCDNPPCVRPGHLFVGTQAVNMADKVAKGRQARGETHGGNSSITEDMVRGLRLLYQGRGSGQQGNLSALASAVGLSTNTVRDIVYGRSWQHVA